MSRIRLETISKTFGEELALSKVSLDIQDNEFFVLLGPTGAGKTTTLRVIAGLEKQDAGHVYFDESLVDSIPPADRDTAFVFQQYSLYPNMTVYENLAFPLKSPLRNFDAADIDRRIKDAAEKLRITHLLERKTARLSGGEMQRVSIGRAIVRKPRVFLMDEPLSNLDAKLRESLRVELKHLQKTQEVTTLFVTHDQIEALTMADRLAVLNNGKIIQIGSPDDIYDRPASTFVAQLVGTPRINLFETEFAGGKLHSLKNALEFDATGLEPASKTLVGIRPEDISISAQGTFHAKVVLKEPLGVETIVHLQTEDNKLLAIVPGISHHQIGETVKFEVNSDRLHFFTTEGERIEAKGVAA
ncbi:MAG: ABC transporter ATP-binding protein [Trueperaceae bacterium]|nr:ABC transporter ATP-binding protein [Trueperaceae bacterium]